MGLGEQIAAARRAKGWSQTRLAEELILMRGTDTSTA